MKISVILAAVAVVSVFSVNGFGASNSLQAPEAEKRVEDRILKLVEQHKSQSGGEKISTAMKLYTLRAGQVLCGYNKPTGDGQAAEKENDKKMTECLNLLLESENLDIPDRFPRFCEIAKLKGDAKASCGKDAEKANKEMKEFTERFVAGRDISEAFSEQIIDKSYKFGAEDDSSGGGSGGGQQ